MMSSRAQTTAAARKRPNLSNGARQAIYEHLLAESDRGELRHGALLRASRLFNTSINTVSRIWRQGRASATDPHPL